VLPAVDGRRSGEISLGAVLPIGQDHDDYAALLIANAILGGSVNSRLFSEVRERAGLSYSIGSRLRPRVGENAALWTIDASYDIENAERTRSAVMAELARATRDGFTTEEVRTAARGYLARSLLRRAEDAALAELLTLRTPESLSAFEARIAGLRADAVTAAFRRYIGGAALTTVRIAAPGREGGTGK
jgi:zinc protease